MKWILDFLPESSGDSNLLLERVGLRPVAIFLAGLQVFMPVSVSVASVVQAASSPEKNEQLNHDNQLARGGQEAPPYRNAPPAPGNSH